MTLTEQWKKGELEEHKKYYCKTKWFEDIFQAICYNKDTEDEWWVLKNEKYNYNNIYHTEDIEVLAPVPSYEEWQQLKEDYADKHDKYLRLSTTNHQLRKFLEEFNALDVAKENQQLKELLLECSEFLCEILAGTQIKLSFKLESGIRKKHYMMSLSELKTKIDNAIGENK